MRVAEAIDRFGLGALRNKVERGMWQKPCRGVVVLHNGPLSFDQRHAVALASAANGAALAGLTALAYDRFTGFDSPQLQIVLPSGARRASMKDLTLHWSTQLDERDVHPSRTPRRTRPARSLIDAASWTKNPRLARAIIISGVQQGTTNVRGLREALTRRGPCRHRALIVESVLDASGGVQSLPERDFGEICDWVGLPRPGRQQRIRGQAGTYHLDATWEQIGMSAEVHGIPHHAIERWSADLERANEIVISGERLLAFSSYAVRHEQRAVGGQLVRMARSLGWTGSSTDLSTLTPSEQRKRRKIGRYAA